MSEIPAQETKNESQTNGEQHTISHSPQQPSSCAQTPPSQCENGIISVVPPQVPKNVLLSKQETDQTIEHLKDHQEEAEEYANVLLAAGRTLEAQHKKIEAYCCYKAITDDSTVSLKTKVLSYIHLTELLPNPKCIVWAEKAWEALKDNSDLFGSSTVLLEVRTAFYAHKEHETIMRHKDQLNLIIPLIISFASEKREQKQQTDNISLNIETDTIKKEKDEGQLNKQDLNPEQETTKTNTYKGMKIKQECEQLESMDVEKLPKENSFELEIMQQLDLFLQTNEKEAKEKLLQSLFSFEKDPVMKVYLFLSLPFDKKRLIETRSFADTLTEEYIYLKLCYYFNLLYYAYVFSPENKEDILECVAQVVDDTTNVISRKATENDPIWIKYYAPPSLLPLCGLCGTTKMRDSIHSLTVIKGSEFKRDYVLLKYILLEMYFYESLKKHSLKKSAEILLKIKKFTRSMLENDLGKKNYYRYLYALFLTKCAEAAEISGDAQIASQFIATASDALIGNNSPAAILLASHLSRSPQSDSLRSLFDYPNATVSEYAQLLSKKTGEELFEFSTKNKSFPRVLLLPAFFDLCKKGITENNKEWYYHQLNPLQEEATKTESPVLIISALRLLRKVMMKEEGEEEEGGENCEEVDDVIDSYLPRVEKVYFL